MAEVTHLLFVYGTLRSDYRHPAHIYIARYFTLTGKARVRGKLYDCIEYPGAVPDEGDFYISGELYDIRNKEEFLQAMRVLDEYEGSYDKPGQPALFRREKVPVFFKDEKLMAWIYWYNRPVTGLTWIKSGDILKTDQ